MGKVYPLQYAVTKTRYLHTKEWKWTLLLHHSQKLTWNSLKTNMIWNYKASREKKIVKNSFTLVLTIFSDMTPKAQATKAKIN